MFRPVELPLWLLILILAFAAISFATHFLFPSVRWFFRRRMERVLGRVNARLDRKIEPFKLARRRDMVARLLYDPRVLDAVADHAAETGVPGEVALQEARAYAREIVPSFSAYFYFGFATRAARGLSRVFYRVMVGKVANELEQIDPRSTVVFVMNHRSNMDYVLVTWLVADRTTISYAVGEWARVWPLSALIRAMGAYFIRRKSRNTLYRRVLARYVQMATAEGRTQAIFPEGGLSLDGRVGPAKLGLLSYIAEGFDPGGPDVVFVPVGLAYDRVLEDSLLVRAGKSGVRRFRAPLLRVCWQTLRIVMKRAGGRVHLYGVAAAGFGAPVSLRAHLDGGGTVQTLGARLMQNIAGVVPVTSVPLVAAAVRSGQPVAELAARLAASGAVLQLPPAGPPAAEVEGRAMLAARGLLSPGGAPLPGAGDLLAFYAAPVEQMLEAGRPAVNAATPQT